MSTKNGFLRDLRRAMVGLTYAELGEYLPQEEKEAILGVPREHSPGPLPPRAVAQADRRIALAVQRRTQADALRYARNACERLDADLDVLTDVAETALGVAIEPARRSLAQRGHRLEIVRLGRDLLTDIVRYARERHGLLFVVVSAEDAFADSVVAGRGTSLHVPWVVVAPAGN